MITEKRFKVAVYDDNAINGFAVLDLQKPNSSKRLKYENVYIGSKVECEIVCNFGNSLADENEQLRKENDMFSCELSVSANKEISRNCRIAELDEENEQLKQENEKLQDEYDYLLWLHNGLGCEYDWLKEENEQLKKE